MTMTSGAIYQKCEEPEDIGNMASMASRKAGGFLLRHCRCGSDETSISVLFIVNAVSFVLWTIITAVLFSKYSEMARELEQLRTNQTALRANGSNMEKELKQLHSSQSTYAPCCIAKRSVLLSLSTEAPIPPFPSPADAAVPPECCTLQEGQAQRSALGSRLDSGLQKMEDDQNGLKTNMTKRLTDTQMEREKIRAETFRILDVLNKMNSSACQVCPAGWLLNRGQCYYFQEQAKQWSFAKQSCQDQGSHLVIINDVEEQLFLNAKKKSIIYWIGLSDMQTETKFVWVDGTSPTYTHWYPREPNNANRGEDCAALESMGWWNDRECGSTTDGWICEKPWKC